MKCPTCASVNIRDIFFSKNTHGRHMVNARDEFTVSKCGNCRLIFLKNIKVDRDYYKKYYQLGYYDKTDMEPNGLVDKFLNLISRYSISRKEEIIINTLGGEEEKNSILDVGCGSGIFLSGLDPERFSKFGSEINKEGFEICRKRGINVFYGDISKIDFGKKKFDIISLWHVLEHVEKPNQLFKTIHKILKPGGVLIFQTPNTDSFGFKLGKKNWFHLDSPRHLMLYNQKSVATLCQKTGFKIKNTQNEYYDYPLDLFWSVRNSTLKVIIYPLYPIFKFLSREHLTYVCAKD